MSMWMDPSRNECEMYGTHSDAASLGTGIIPQNRKVDAFLIIKVLKVKQREAEIC